jgi:hypothetical protein
MKRKKVVPIDADGENERQYSDCTVEKVVVRRQRESSVRHEADHSQITVVDTRY